MARSCLKIDLTAIASNWAALDALSGPDVETGAVVKADAYGLGLDRVAPALASAGARSFFVALPAEGSRLRKILGPGPDIHVFSGYMGEETFRDANLIPLLNSPDQIRAFRAEHPGRAYGLQLDSGMNRLGVEPADLPQGLSPTLVVSHLACADTPDHAQNTAQLKAFHEMIGAMGDVRASLAATGGILLGDDYHFAVTRPGIGLYGGLPFVNAMPVVTLEVPVIQTRTVRAGETVGYGAVWTASRDSRIATIAAGYADGLFRALGNAATVHAGDTPCPVVGRISMDLITVDVTALKDDPASLTVLGPHQSIDHLATAAGTIGYEILTSLGHRYERVYKGA